MSSVVGIPTSKLRRRCSARSLRSRGHISNESDSQCPTNVSNIRSRKPTAYWTKQEEELFLQFLHEQKSITDDGNFKTKTFNEVSNHLKEKFPMQRSAEKTHSVCHSKWANRASGFTWSDEHGAGITLETESAWAAFVKGCAAAKSFKNKGFPFFDLINNIHLHGKRQGNNSNIYYSPTGFDSMSSTMTSSASSALEALNLSPPTPSVNETNTSTSMRRDATTEATGSNLPNLSLPSSVPSTFLSSSNTSSVITSVSRNSKHRHDSQSAFGSVPPVSGGKCSRPVSVAAKVQQESSDELVRFNNIFETFTVKFDDSQSSSNPEYTQALKLLRDDSTTIGLSPQERMDIGSFLGRNPRDITLYVNSDVEVRELWL
ncbi:uncharacterized protein HD556DRAFT_1445652 [Suillus plorans]|uniref:Myb-like domain-containing protein n=1 Tax=Suillus plorans TaxID=116603 RepID=A0A9P7AJR8_9AGAM|nr:uncharacterized protein HD556DRAFT_1445652 [Suillus plorans]KAG1790871.1 hypothetical protein HD556DRAFT_1445652 [Suillus plorans]